MKEFGIHNFVDNLVCFANRIYTAYLWDELRLKIICWVRLKRIGVYGSVANNNMVIAMDDKYVSFGGLADRLRGIISLYAWCKQNDKEFKIYFVHPFSLSDYLVPNKYDWLVQNPQSVYHGIPILIDTPSGSENVIGFQKSMFDKYLSLLGKQVNCYTNADIIKDRKVFSLLFKELFKPSVSLQSLIDKYSLVLGKDYVSVSFRYGGALGDFKDSIKIDLNETERQRLIEACLAALEDIHKLCHKRILVATDSPRFMEIVRQKEFVTVLPGEIVHSAHSSSKASHMKTFLDFMMIANASKIYLVRGKYLYNSGFPKKASMINNTPFKEYFIR